ncbi:MAG: Calx-beta domain-containing protein [Prosthecobacter sp.]|nr:Calx-beta domain-containing protein [Prosthecobacter sp.]
MKLFSPRLMPLLALTAGALLMTPPARAATSANGDIFLGVRATSGTGSTKTFVINLGQASQLENATTALPLGSIGTDLTATFGASWNTRNNVFWGIGGTIGSFSAIGTDPAKTVFGSRSVQSPWLRQNEASQGAATNKIVALSTAFNGSSSVGVTATNAVVQTITDSNSWASYQPGGSNAGPAPGTSFAFFNPSVEASFENGVAGAILHFYRVKPATTGAEIDTDGDYLGRFIITTGGDVTFVPVAALGANTVNIENAIYSVGETDGSLDVKVVRSGDLSTEAGVTIGVTGGTATTPEDFTFTGGAVSFAIGESEKTQTITIENRSGFQGNRTVVLGLSSATNASIGTTGSSTVTITEDIEPSEVNLVDAQVDVNAEAASVTINLERSGGASPVTVDIATADVTALAGTNYTAPTGGAQTVTFAANATTATASISLLSAVITQNKTFNVTLTNPDANTTVGTNAPTTTVVRILAPDAAAPTVTITAPTANQIIPTVSGPAVLVTGTSSDNVEVERVQVSLNGGAFTNATGTTAWSRTVTAVGGLNTVSVRALDARGNTSIVATRSFTYVKTGALAGVTNPANNTLGTVTAPLAGANAYQVGKTYTLKATPKTGNVFTGWTVPGLAGAATESPVLTFVYTEAILASPTITANFAASPFAATEIGDFNGLVSPRAGTASSNSTNGAMKLTVTKTGSFSGTLLIDGFKLMIAGGSFTGPGNGFFGATSSSTLLVPRGTKPSLELSSVHWDSATNTITGVVKQYYRSAVIAQSDFTLDRAGFSSAAPNKLPAASPYLANGGLFTVILPAKAQTNGLLPEDYPQGDGVGTITVTSNGVLKLAAKLADDTAVTASVPLSAALKAPLFAQLYSTKGSFTALVQLNSAAADSDMTAVDSLWFRPWLNAVQWYPWGWEEGVKVDLLGASYVKTGSVIPGVLPTADTTIANADLVFSDGLLTESVNAEVNVSPANKVKTLSTPSAPALSFTLTIGAATGDISGAFTHTDATKPKFVGKVYQKGTAAGAYGYFLTTKPKVLNGLGQSGGLSLNHK